MTNENPGKQSSANAAESGQSQADRIAPGLAAYNIVSDTVTGVNVRARDNLLQAVFILLTVVLGAIVGAVFAGFNADWNLPWYGGAMIGGFAGLVLGFFTRDFFLMIYRAVRHLQGKHD